nr:MAG TPA: hypothetical protein [Caudoviricetes sp.]
MRKTAIIILLMLWALIAWFIGCGIGGLIKIIVG